MATATASQVQALYVGYLGRAADQGGLDFWTKAIADGTSTLESVALGFTVSAEYQALYANKTNEQLASAIYQNVFGRPADTEGLAFWTGEITNGTVTADTLLSAMLNSLGTVDQQTINNKVFVANAYTAAAGADYSATAGAQILVGVDSTSASVAAALASVPAINSAGLVAALAELKTANTAVESFLKALDLNGDGKADNSGNAAANLSALNLAHDNAVTAVDAAVAANGDLSVGDWEDLTAAQQSAELAKVKVSLAAAETNAKTDVDVAYAGMSAALKTAITNYETADAAQKSSAVAEGKADADLTAAIAKYNLVAATDISFMTSVDSASAAAAAAFASLITVDGAKFSAALATGVSETTNPGVTAVLTALQADLNAEKALAAANAGLETAQDALDLADGGTADGGATFVLADDAPAYSAYLGLKGDLVAVQNTIKAVDQAVTALSAVETKVAALGELQKAVVAAQSTIGAAGYDLNNANGSLDLNADGDFTDVGEFNFVGGLDADEAELYTAGYTGAAVTMDEGDMIFVGGYTFNDGALAAGNNNVLEFFVTQTATDLVVSFETSAFGSNAATPEVSAITLTGLTMDDVVIGSQFITLA